MIDFRSIRVTNRKADLVDPAIVRYERARIIGSDREWLPVTATVTDILRWRSLEGVRTLTEIADSKNETWVITARIANDLFRKISQLSFVCSLKLALPLGLLE